MMAQPSVCVRFPASRLLMAVCVLFVVGITRQTMAQDGSSGERPEVLLKTSMGEIQIELNPQEAPKTVENFLNYVKSDFYDGTVFHRVIPGFMIQGGGLDKDLVEKPTQDPIVNEAGNGLSNKKYTIAMARTPDPDSATSQFFINVADNANLDRTPGSAGYAVFGRVVKGLEVVDKIASVKTGRKPAGGPRPMLMRDVPLEPVVIEEAKVVESSR